MALMNSRQIASAARFFFKLPTIGKIAVLGILAATALVACSRLQTTPVSPTPPGGTHSVVFMCWNVENLFDDRDDRRNSIDEPYDNWFAHDAEARKLKYDHLAEIILRVNDGKGPDVFAGVEVESLRSAELLMETLNAKLPEGSKKYEHVAMKELTQHAGRYMAPCLISRIPLDSARTRLVGKNNLRILETHLVSEQRDLLVMVGHWTSKLKQADGSNGESGREKYAAAIYDEYAAAMKADASVDVLVCGDFNDTPDSNPIAKTLHMTADKSLVVPNANPPRLLGLLCGKAADKFGTIYYAAPLIYDHIGVSPGMLDEIGWSCDPESVRVPTEGLIRDRARTRKPWRFGDKNDNAQGRGYSDHFPVVVNLRVK